MISSIGLFRQLPPEARLNLQTDFMVTMSGGSLMLAALRATLSLSVLIWRCRGSKIGLGIPSSNE